MNDNDKQRIDGTVEGGDWEGFPQGSGSGGIKTTQERAMEGSVGFSEAISAPGATPKAGEGGSSAKTHPLDPAHLRTGNKHVDEAMREAAAKMTEVGNEIAQIENPEQYANSFSWEALAVGHLQGKCRLSYQRVEAKKMFEAKIREFRNGALREMTDREKGCLALMLHTIATQEEIEEYAALGKPVPTFPELPAGFDRAPN